MGNLSTLEDLWLRYNELSGSIPAELGNLGNLESLFLKENSLSGCVPDALRDSVVSSDMYQAGLYFCSDTPPPAPTPDPDGVTKDREALVALYNATDGANWTNNTNWLSAEPLGNWHGVGTDTNGRVGLLDLGSNGLNGTIPDLSALTSAKRIFLEDNQLSGSILGLSALTQLIYLYLHDNQLSGPMLDLSAFGNLKTLYLNNNSLSGPIRGVHALYNIFSMRLNGNPLCLPEDFDLSAIGNDNVYGVMYHLNLPTCTDEQDPAGPGTPQNLTATTGVGQAVLAWNTVSDAASYDLRAWDSVDRRWGSIGGVITTTSYTHTVETDGRSYYYQVRALDANGNPSAWSEEVAANFSGSQFPPPPPSLGVDSFYHKYADANGVAVVAPWHVPDSYLIRGQGVITGMFTSRSDLLENLAAEHSKVAIEPGIRGLAIRDSVGWWAYTPQHDTYCHTMVHEIAHLVHYLLEDEPFDDRLLTMYEDALDAGLWAGVYASTNYKEYWGQGVSFQLTDAYQNRYHSSVTLAEYDADLAALVDEVFGTTTLPASCDE